MEFPYNKYFFLFAIIIVSVKNKIEKPKKDFDFYVYQIFISPSIRHIVFYEYDFTIDE